MIHPSEIAAALRGMVILIDTREQDTPKLRQRIRQMNVPTEREALSFGDYSAKFPLPSGGWFSLKDVVCIERKMSLDELAGCFGKERARFSREFERARTQGAKVYLLLEGGSWEDAFGGRYRSKMSPQSLTASMLAWLARYDCQIIMCKADTSGKLIHDILYREGKERLERMAGEEETC